jgi:phosphoglycerate dehydrogenase-like enzyme
MALLLSLYRVLHESVALQAAETWDPSIESQMSSLYNKTVAIIGYGSIGREIGVRAFAHLAPTC